MNAPEEVSADDIEELPQPVLLTVPIAGAPTTTPPSGSPPSDEWFGHVLFGYAPFNVAVYHRAITGEIPTTPMQPQRKPGDEVPPEAKR